MNLASPSSSLRPANLHRAVTEGGIDLEMAGGGSDQTLEGTRAERRRVSFMFISHPGAKLIAVSCDC